MMDELSTRTGKLYILKIEELHGRLQLATSLQKNSIVKGMECSKHIQRKGNLEPKLGHKRIFATEVSGGGRQRTKTSRYETLPLFSSYFFHVPSFPLCLFLPSGLVLTTLASMQRVTKNIEESSSKRDIFLLTESTTG